MRNLPLGNEPTFCAASGHPGFMAIRAASRKC